MYGQATLITSLLFLIFSKSPFGVLIFAILAGNATSWDDWMMYVAILLIQQIGYTAWMATKS